MVRTETSGEQDETGRSPPSFPEYGLTLGPSGSTLPSGLVGGFGDVGY